MFKAVLDKVKELFNGKQEEPATEAPKLRKIVLNKDTSNPPVEPYYHIEDVIVAGETETSKRQRIKQRLMDELSRETDGGRINAINKAIKKLG